MPEVIERVQTFKAETLGNPAIPFPWPPYVQKPEANELKTCFSQLARVIWFRDRRTLKAQKGGSLCKKN